MQFEPRFSPVADTYRAFRPGYPPELFEKILAALPANMRTRAMDLGAGTGLSAAPLAEAFAEVIAVEPDVSMAQKLHELCPNLIVRQTTAEECEQPPESVDLVTTGTAFHWMDGPRVLANVRRWLRPGGVLALFSYRFPRAPDPVRAVFRREFELHWERFCHERLRNRDYARRKLAAALGFGSIEENILQNQVGYTAANLVGFCRWTSYGGAYLRTLENPEAYLRQLEAGFRTAHPEGAIPITFELELLLTHKR